MTRFTLSGQRNYVLLPVPSKLKLGSHHATAMAFVTAGGKSPAPEDTGSEAMNRFARVTAIALLLASLGLPGTISPAFSQSPPTTDRARQVEALVNKAAGVIEEKGKASFAEFRKKDSEWFHGDTYLFVYDLKANVLLNPAFPQREGTNVTGQKDANGKLFHNEIIQVAQSKGSGWVDYMFPKPGQTEPSQKWAYVKKVTIDGTPGLVASGFYP